MPPAYGSVATATMLRPASMPTATFRPDPGLLAGPRQPLQDRPRKPRFLMLALISFDHSKPGNRNAEAWRRMYSRPEGRKSFVDNYTIPLVERYKGNPWFFAIDVGNELVWTWENHKVARKDALDLVARVANAVHARSQVLVCEGEGAGPKYNSSKFAGNLYSDKSLGGSNRPHVDFYNIHYYDWVRPWFGSPFERSPADYGMDDKPCIIGECPARAVPASRLPKTIRMRSQRAGRASCLGHRTEWTATAT